MEPKTISTTLLSDYYFYYSLKKYRPICYSGTGMPLLLANEGWRNSLSCVACLDVLAIACLTFFGLNMGKFAERDDMRPGPLTLLLLSILVLVLANISVVLTQLMNPGIRNPFSITESQF